MRRQEGADRYAGDDNAICEEPLGSIGSCLKSHADAEFGDWDES